MRQARKASSLLGIVSSAAIALVISSLVAARDAIPADVPTGVGNDEQSNLEVWFRNEYPIALKRLKETAQNLRCVARSEYPKSNRETTYYLKDECYLWQDEFLETKQDFPFMRVRCRNQRSTFKLEKRRRDASFVLISYSGQESAMSRARFESCIRMRPFVWGAFCLFDQPIDELVVAPEFKLTNISQGGEREQDLVTVEFVLEGEHFWYESGRMVIDRNLGCSLREYEVVHRPNDGARSTDPGKATDSGRVECVRWGTDDKKFVFPKLVEVLRRNELGDEEATAYEQKYKVEFQSVEPGVVTDDQFTLQAFAVPEIPLPSDSLGSRRKSVLWLLYLNLGIAILLCVIYACLRWRSTRTESKDCGK